MNLVQIDIYVRYCGEIFWRNQRYKRQEQIKGGGGQSEPSEIRKSVFECFFFVNEAISCLQSIFTFTSPNARIERTHQERKKERASEDSSKRKKEKRNTEKNKIQIRAT